MTTNNPHSVQGLERELKMIEFYRKHPVIAAEDLLRVKLAVPQQAILRDMWFKNFVLVTAGRGVGKTFLNSVFACLWALLYPGQKVGLLAPSFRQAKMLFAEVEKRWNMAPLLQEATARKPITASDRCYLEFRQAGFSAGSMIEAVPLGDGSKIRGARYYAILADEFAQIPEDIFNTVILPMGATVADPMANVERIARQKALIKSGRATAADFGKRRDNKVIVTSSAFYQFNHMYQTKVNYEEAIRRGEDQYAVHTVSFRDMPEGFLSEENIRNSRLKLSSLEFRMEYEAIWEADSAGVFKASLISKCQGNANHSVVLQGNPGSEYVLGVDPARASDAFALCLIEVGSVNKVVAAWEYYQNVFPKMAQTIMDICNNFNVIAVHMDAGAGGGGLAMKDLLFEEERWGANARLVDANDDDYKHLQGRHILHMFQPSPKSNAEAVFAALNLMEKDSLTFPQRPQPRGNNKEAFVELEEAEKLYDTVTTLTRQLMLIEVSESRSGVAHFDVPSGGGHAAQKKDLFTSFILASKKAYDLMISDDTGNGILEVGLVADRPNYQIPEKKKLSDSLVVSQVPMNSWPFKKKFKPGL
jgi:hypothetical protein